MRNYSLYYVRYLIGKSDIVVLEKFQALFQVLQEICIHSIVISTLTIYVWELQSDRISTYTKSITTTPKSISRLTSCNFELVLSIFGKKYRDCKYLIEKTVLLIPTFNLQAFIQSIDSDKKVLVNTWSIIGSKKSNIFRGGGGGARYINTFDNINTVSTTLVLTNSISTQTQVSTNWAQGPNFNQPGCLLFGDMTISLQTTEPNKMTAIFVRIFEIEWDIYISKGITLKQFSFHTC